jgi:hypothetical protein
MGQMALFRQDTFKSSKNQMNKQSLTVNVQKRKLLIYLAFAIATAVVIIAFVTAKTYIQLAIAAALYPLVAYFAFYLFSRHQKPAVKSEPAPQPAVVKSPTKDSRVVDIIDFDRRAFLKLIGATGLSFFLFSLLGRRVETLLFNQPSDSGTASTTGQVGPVSPTEGYRISEIDDGETAYYGFTAQDRSWLIMREDPSEGSFRYARGEVNFPSYWARRQSLNYSYFHELF